VSIFDQIGPTIGGFLGEAVSYYDPSDLTTVIPTTVRSFVELKTTATVQSDGSGDLLHAEAVIAAGASPAPVKLGRIVRNSLTWTIVSVRTLPGGDYECSLQATASMMHGQPERRIRRS
jgi:hypothetical protein